MTEFDDGFVNPNFPLGNFSLPPTGGPSQSSASSASRDSNINRFDVPPSANYGVQYVVAPPGSVQSQPQSQQQQQQQQPIAWQYSGLNETPASPPGTAAAAAKPQVAHSEKDAWAMTQGERKRYEQQFRELPTLSNYLPGDQARTFFVKSKLPTADLSAIWRLSDIDKDGQLSLDEFCIAMHLTVGRRKGKSIPETTPLCLLSEIKKDSFKETWPAPKQPDVIDQAFQPQLQPPQSRVQGAGAPLAQGLNFRSRVGATTSVTSPVKSNPGMIHVTLPGMSPKAKPSSESSQKGLDEVDSPSVFKRNPLEQFESGATDSGSELQPPPPVEKPKDLVSAGTVDLLAPPSLPPKKKAQVKKAKSVREKGSVKAKRRASGYEKYSILGDEESLLEPFDVDLSTTLSGMQKRQTSTQQNPPPPQQRYHSHHLVASQTAPVIILPPPSQAATSAAVAMNQTQVTAPAEVPVVLPRDAAVASASPSLSKRSPQMKEKGHSRSSSLDVNIVFQSQEQKIGEEPEKELEDQKKAADFDFPPTLPPRDFPAGPPKRKPKKPAPEPPADRPLRGHMIPVKDFEDSDGGGSPATRKGHKKAVSLDTFSSKETRNFTQELRAKSPDNWPGSRKEGSISPSYLPDVSEVPQEGNVVRREKKKAPPVPRPFHRYSKSLSPDDLIGSSIQRDTYATVNKAKKDKRVVLDATRRLKNECLALGRLNDELNNDLIKIKEERQRLQVQLENLQSTAN